jgi:hypothetical protein
MTSDRFLQLEDRIFTEWRLRGYGSIVIFTSLFLGWILFEGRWPILADGRPYCVDFGLFWLSGKFAAAGHAAMIFDFSGAWSDAQSAFYGPLVSDGLPGPGCYYRQPFYYPPPYLFFTYPLSFMSYETAFAAWLGALFLLYQIVVYAIVPRRTALIVAAAPVFLMATNLLTGQNGFISTALIGLSLVSMERRPCISGVFLGLLTYKPHLGLLFPIALLASRNWRVLVSATATAVVFGVLATAAFGHEGWISFIHGLTSRSSGLGVAPGHELAVQSVFGLLHWAGADQWFAWSVQLAVSAIVVLGTWMLWASKSVPYNLKAAALCAGTCLVSPYVMPYDLAILSISVAFLVKEALARGFLPGERSAIFICWVLFFFELADIGPVICAVLLSLIARRMSSEEKSSTGRNPVRLMPVVYQ